MHAFLDTSALIYLMEGAESVASKLRGRLALLAQQHPDTAIALSRLTWLECRVGPLKSQDGATLRRYDDFFARPGLRWIELSQTVVELATVIRVRHGLRTPDALQAACCLQLGGQHRVFTGDAAFLRVAGLNVEPID